MKIGIIKTDKIGDLNAIVSIAEQIVGNHLNVNPNLYVDGDDLYDKNSPIQYDLSNLPELPDVAIGSCQHVRFMLSVRSLPKYIDNIEVVVLRSAELETTIQSKRILLNKADLVITYPEHDYVNANCVVREFVPNKVTEQGLINAGLQFHSTFDKLKHIGLLIRLLVGGDVAGKMFSSSKYKELGAKINMIFASMEATAIISFSARTSLSKMSLLTDQITVPHMSYDSRTDKGKSPYMGILSFSVYIVVTADSISMFCESLCSGRPVYIYANEDNMDASHLSVRNIIIELGYARSIESVDYLYVFGYTNTSSAQFVANKVTALFKESNLPNKMVPTSVLESAH